MKNNFLRSLPVLTLLLANEFCFATTPSKLVRDSCLLDEAISPSVSIFKFPTNLIQEQEDYSDGYHAVYYFLDGKTEIGYAEKPGKSGVIYARKIYPLDDAKVISKSHAQPSEFSPALASWNRVKDPSGSYLCVNFNFDGIGRSGSFQNFKGGYLLDIGEGKAILYYIEGDVRVIRRAINRK